ncbi:hypothetical protein PC129_g8436 [Phytophthora cactorum]|uniref:Reverse transcriptase domain-containing protein n=2 Tax=Phytophthora cactorum TaxID=29920 RepID=A0A8T1CGK6_9STRA|nr:hypothetical protein Pcac1_g11561 [Phytophthora cactorum]KAG2905662.1 hypothetical protein PC114_g11443 [Phytophthora cactorum]KAG2921399.1 hypothetical protein PC115_g9527 [Phytophthora cactorum]KAG3064452.1 hypothetical protein PC121_g11684 [Phytophthora cactorum]KAG3084452.1 hypothetical protein PC122_g10122 [Phytophthora cactorum]
MTDDGGFTPTRVAQGGVESALHFQSTMQTVLDPLIPQHALVWIDDVIIFADNVGDFLRVLKVFFELIVQHNLKLSLPQSSLYQTSINWCGRLISSDGVRHDPERVSALSTLPLPRTVEELRYFVCASNWLHDSLVDYARTVAPLQVKLDADRKRIGRRGRNALNVEVEWTPAEKATYEEVLVLIATPALRSFPRDDDELCVFTDANLDGYNIVVTLVCNWDSSKPVDKQEHVVVVCRGGMFKEHQRGWSIIEREAFPIIQACMELDFILLRRKGSSFFVITPI